MRFGREFEDAKVPAWYQYYIDYDRLKHRIKKRHRAALVGKYNDTHDWMNIRHQCHRARDFYESECERLSHVENRITAAIARVIPNEQIARCKLQHAQLLVARCALSSIKKRTEDLLLFAKTNTSAVHRIIEKLEKATPCKDDNSSKAGAYDLSVDSQICLELYARTEQTFRSIPPEITGDTSTLQLGVDGILEPFILRGCGLAENSLGPLSTENFHTTLELCGLAVAGGEASLRTALDLYMRDQFNKLSATESSPVASTTNNENDHDEAIKLAVSYGLVDTSIALLEARDIHPEMPPPTPDRDSDAVELMALAAANQHDELVDLVDWLLAHFGPLEGWTDAHVKKTLMSMARMALLTRNVVLLDIFFACNGDPNGHDSGTEPLLLLAARKMPDAVMALLQHGADANACEEETGRSALMLACISGDKGLVQTLLDFGARADIVDALGWTAAEHAAYRGFMELVEVLRRHRAGRTTAATNGSANERPMLQARKDAIPRRPWLQDEDVASRSSYLWLWLGTHDANKPERALRFLGDDAPAVGRELEHEAMFSITFSCPDSGAHYSTQLPELGTNINRPWLFTVDDPTKAQLLCSLYKHDANAAGRKRLVGTGIAAPGVANTGLRSFRESLIRELEIPLQDPSGSSCAAMLTVSFFAASPHPPPPALATRHFWDFGNGVGGHRGSGKNMIDHRTLQIGENTIQSFSTAVEHGASFLEFDVQLTKDLVPVVYHDLILSETGTDAPMHTLTYEQFEHLNRAQAPRQSRFVRSNSVGAVDEHYIADLSDRMAKTNFNKINGFKSNTRGNFIHERSSTLEELLKRMPPSVRLNIELKYPMLFEADEWDMETTAIKTDIFVDTILDTVYKHAQGRTIVFSSFSPEICIALSTKQRAWPVFFLSKTTAPRGELRSSSIQQAIHFARAWGLPGIVVECSPLISCPRLIQYVRSAGLACTSFGVGNSEPENAKVQFDGGINAVITDNLRAITQISNLPSTDGDAEPLRIYA